MTCSHKPFGATPLRPEGEITCAAVDSARCAVEQLMGVLSGAAPRDAAELLAGDCTAFGPRRDDAHAGAASVAEALVSWGDALSAVSSPIAFAANNAQLAVASGGESAWVWAFSSSGDSVEPVGREWRLTALAGKGADGVWRFHHVHLSRGMANAELADIADRMEPLRALGDAVGAGAEVLVPLLTNNLGVGILELVARGADTIIIGTDPDEVFEGAESWLKIAEPMREQLEQLEPTVAHVFSGGVRAGLTPDGQSGAVATNVALDYGGGQLPPFRVGWIFTRVDGLFRLVCDHHSVGWP